MDLTTAAATAIFLFTMGVVAAGKFPGLRVDRTGAAVIGAALMIGVGVLTPQQAYAAVNLDTIALLFGMMIVAANLRLSGFFGLVSAWVVRHVRRPIWLLAAIVAVSGVFSAFFVNDTICLVLTPLVCHVTARLKRNAVPYLLAVAMAANIGSAATITGNPQNMLIGSVSHLSFGAFAAVLSPIAAIGLVVTVAVLSLLYRSEFASGARLAEVEEQVRVRPPLLWRSALVAAAMVVFFFLGQPVPKVALLAGAFLLITRRVRPEAVYRQIDFSLLVMFAGLFVVVAGIEQTPWLSDLLAMAQRMQLERVPVLSALAAVLSNLVSNVPAVLMLRPFVTHFHDPHRGWLVLAMASTLAGNFTITGSVANLIVVQRARQEGVRVSFREYFRAGAPLTVITIAIGILMLSL
ncbi:MAG: anion transporter [Bryobacteraceae bacterium]|jgi:Na+/H+ antiporter NhaD/arsenite permease-like protein